MVPTVFPPFSSVITCPARYPYAFDGGASCCDLSRECSGPVLARSDACCAGSWVDCVDQQRGCYDAGWYTQWSLDFAMLMGTAYVKKKKATKN